MAENRVEPAVVWFRCGGQLHVVRGDFEYISDLQSAIHAKLGTSFATARIDVRMQEGAAAFSGEEAFRAVPPSALRHPSDPTSAPLHVEVRRRRRDPGRSSPRRRPEPPSGDPQVRDAYRVSRMTVDEAGTLQPCAAEAPYVAPPRGHPIPTPPRTQLPPDMLPRLTPASRSEIWQETPLPAHPYAYANGMQWGTGYDDGWAPVPQAQRYAARSARGLPTPPSSARTRCSPATAGAECSVPQYAVHGHPHSWGPNHDTVSPQPPPPAGHPTPEALQQQVDDLLLQQRRLQEHLRRLSEDVHGYTPAAAGRTAAGEPYERLSSGAPNGVLVPPSLRGKLASLCSATQAIQNEIGAFLGTPSSPALPAPQPTPPRGGAPRHESPSGGHCNSGGQNDPIGSPAIGGMLGVDAEMASVSGGSGMSPRSPAAPRTGAISSAVAHGLPEGSHIIQDMAKRLRAPRGTRVGDPIRKATGSLQDLLRTATEIVSAGMKDIKPLCTVTAGKVAWLLNCERCTIWVKHQSQEALYAFVDRQAGSTCQIKSVMIESTIKRLTMPIRPGPGQSLTPELQVLETGEPVSVTSEHAPEGLLIEHTECCEVRNAVYCPITADDHIFGVCKVVNKKSGDGDGLFSAEDDNLLSVLLMFVGSCFKNSLLYQDLNQSHSKTEILLGLTQTLSNCDLNYRRLCNSIIATAKRLLRADRCALFLLDKQTNELEIQFEDRTDEDQVNPRMPMSAGIAGYVATTGKTANIPDAYSDERFNREMDRQTGYRTKNILCAPIKYEDHIVAVAQLVNKEGGAFTPEDEDLFATFSIFTGINIRNCLVHEHLRQEKRMVEQILVIVSEIQKVDIMQVDVISNKIMSCAKELIQCEHCFLLEVDRETAELVHRTVDGKEFRVCTHSTIAGHTVSTGETVNIADVTRDPRFDSHQTAIGETPYETRSVLCMPVRYESDIIAVALLINKCVQSSFGDEDERVLGALSEFAAMCLRNAHLVQFMRKNEEQNMRLMEAQLSGPHAAMAGAESASLLLIPASQLQQILSVQLTEEEKRLLLTARFPIHNYNINNEEHHERLIPLAVQIFRELNIPQQFDVPEDVIVRFVCMVSRKYRRVPYHNWTHAFDVTQTLATHISSIKIEKWLKPVDWFAIIVAALCHDMDHMGLNNSFQLKAETPLGVLSSSSGSKSVLEIHHCNLAIEILSDQNCNIFCGLQESDRKDAWKTLIEAILATDMARHGELCKTFTETVKVYDVECAEHRRIFVSMLLKCCDISNVTKPFEISRGWAQYLTAEFFWQGDMEKASGLDVTPMFDRQSNTDLAKGQIGFMTHVAQPLFRLLCDAEPGLNHVLAELEKNRATWEKLLALSAQSSQHQLRTNSMSQSGGSAAVGLGQGRPPAAAPASDDLDGIPRRRSLLDCVKSSGTVR
eukprot:TRINITY_DN8739_c0_g3_i1.p1 TRINITY_DN8739_c0_g3~~TRINITY_DN8739_c0_g3_i1.p1  ORF type:complete len:1416 (+),score=354.79 TRINITY_DN8739_c0_g3_i1:93-4340(+)